MNKDAKQKPETKDSEDFKAECMSALLLGSIIVFFVNAFTNPKTDYEYLGDDIDYAFTYVPDRLKAHKKDTNNKATIMYTKNLHDTLINTR